jgi:hypothetical protein
MDVATRKLFPVIFQEAHVIDCDLSKWDKRLRLVVVGGLVGDNFDGQGPIHQIDFVDIEEFQWKSYHLDVELSVDQHCQWVIMDFDIQRRGGSFVITLQSVAPPCPGLSIACRDIAINELDVAIINRVNPKWNRPYAPLARPGLEELATIQRGKQE